MKVRLFVKHLREPYENSTTDNTVDDVSWLGKPASTRGKRVFEKKKIRYCGKSQEESELVSMMNSVRNWRCWVKGSR